MNLGRGTDLAGERFGRLVAEAPVGRSANGTILWRCQCDCGKSNDVRSTVLKAGKAQSCGCLRIEHARKGTHGRTKSPLYYTWKGMWARCTNPKATAYKDYGGRGIGVCERWKSFEAFLEDMGERPKGKTLDRERVNEDYGPGNCKWSTPKEQARNRRIKMAFTHQELLRVGALALARNLAKHRGDTASISATDAELSALGLTITERAA